MCGVRVRVRMCARVCISKANRHVARSHVAIIIIIIIFILAKLGTWFSLLNQKVEVISPYVAYVAAYVCCVRVCVSLNVTVIVMSDVNLGEVKEKDDTKRHIAPTAPSI